MYQPLYFHEVVRNSQAVFILVSFLKTQSLGTKLFSYHLPFPSRMMRGLDQENICYSVTESCPTLCNSRDCSMPGFPVLHHLLELAQTHVHRVSDAIQPSHLLLSPSPPLLSPSPPTLNLC